MALIGKIRKNSWLLVVLIGLGLISFIAMDMTAGDKSVFGSQGTVMAEINGKKIDYNEFSRTDDLIRNQLYRNSGADGLTLRNQTWNYFLEEAIVSKEAEAAGLGVSRAEFEELAFGANVSPIIQSHFRDQATNGINRSVLNQYKNYRADNNWPADQPGLKQWWAHEEKEIMKERKQSKLTTLVGKSMYTPAWMAEMLGQNQNKKVDLAVVKIPYSQIDNASIKLTDADYSAYLKENAAQYKTTEETRKLSYIAFDIEPSAADQAKARDIVAKLAADFRTTDNDTTFVEGRGYLDTKLYEADALSSILKDTIFDLAEGTVYGPYEEANFYKAVKVLEKKSIPDSVEASHILIKVANQQDFASMQQAYSLIDSLKALVDGGADFATLAKEFSEDGSASKGGELGYFAQGQMVGPFNDIAFFNLNEGEYDIVGTQFGFHLVKVTGQKYINNKRGIRLGYVSEPILPSEETVNAMEDKVSSFIETNPDVENMIRAAAGDDAITVENVSGIKRNDFVVSALGAGQTSRDMIKWAYGDNIQIGAVDDGDVSPEVYRYQTTIAFGTQQYYYDNKFVVAALNGIQPAGMPSVAFIKDQIEDAVYNMKKAEMVNGKETDLAVIAAKYSGVKVDTLRNVGFGSTFLPAPIQKSEPKVVATAFNTEVNKISPAIDGTDGVYVLMPIAKPANTTTVNIASTQKSQTGTAASFVRARLMQALKEGAEVTDSRARFF